MAHKLIVSQIKSDGTFDFICPPQLAKSLHAATKSDSQIQQEGLQELKWDTRLEETEIGVTVHVGVTVHEGVVTLNGIVNCYAKKMAAREAAHRVAGVLDVANDNEVKISDGMEREEQYAVPPFMVEDVAVAVVDSRLNNEGTIGLARPHRRRQPSRPRQSTRNRRSSGLHSAGPISQLQSRRPNRGPPQSWLARATNHRQTGRVA